MCKHRHLDWFFIYFLFTLFHILFLSLTISPSATLPFIFMFGSTHFAGRRFYCIGSCQLAWLRFLCWTRLSQTTCARPAGFFRRFFPRSALRVASVVAMIHLSGPTDTLLFPLFFVRSTTSTLCLRTLDGCMKSIVVPSCSWLSQHFTICSIPFCLPWLSCGSASLVRYQAARTARTVL